MAGLSISLTCTRVWPLKTQCPIPLVMRTGLGSSPIRSVMQPLEKNGEVESYGRWVLRILPSEILQAPAVVLIQIGSGISCRRIPKEFYPLL